MKANDIIKTVDTDIMEDLFEKGNSIQVDKTKKWEGKILVKGIEKSFKDKKEFDTIMKSVDDKEVKQMAEIVKDYYED